MGLDVDLKDLNDWHKKLKNLLLQREQKKHEEPTKKKHSKPICKKQKRYTSRLSIFLKIHACPCEVLSQHIL